MCTAGRTNKRGNKRRNKRGNKRRDERGAIAVEAALITPVLALLVFGIVELALLMRDTTSLTSSVHTGARIASAAPGAGRGTCQASADPPPCSPATVPAFAQAAADSIQRAGSAIPKDSFDWVTIYEANAAGFPLPAANRDVASCTIHCVRYVWDDPLDRFRYSSGTWPSSSVNACVNDVAQTTVGVAISAQHRSVTGLFGSVDLRSRTVMRFEPLPSDQCKPNTHQ